ncbi:hypothetical protein VPH35_100536 [Triticum aestivum]|uniref:GTD-binding domain-containing protein n=1 Tax=Triticum aestivum TaxID=4565 RepID=A0A3B6MZC6_WHEAT|nr:myosin-binding protein 2-like [Triticum aestivum]XP_044399644.1 myosin-binding protein 2-like [Triticum aestivum]XP_044399645.1 myosin-binding protein 2-like [Triticum aestivum]
MATTSSTAWGSHRQFSALLSSAVLEWVLILLMLLEGLLSRLATAFARLCNLPPPCPACARLDAVLGGARPGSSYRDLLCSSHRAEASSSRAFCHDGGMGIGDVLRDRLAVDDEIDRAGYSELRASDSESELRRRSPEDAAAIDRLKEQLTLTQVQSGVPDRTHAAEDSREPGSIEADIQSTDLPTKDEEPHTKVANGVLQSELMQVQSGKLHSEDPDNIQTSDVSTKDEEPHTDTGDHNPEEDVWHDADDGEPSETEAAADEPDPEFSDRATTRQDSLRVHQHLKLLLSQLSTSSSFRAPDSPSVQEQQHEQAVLRNITRALSLQRNYSGVSDGSVAGAEGEAEECGTVDELKRRVELDRRSMALLWKELEEERSASAVATSQAMAMITRLQEEKAAMRTEAAQYRRVMEEQSAYDRDDAERLAGVVRELEAEVEGYKARLRDHEIVGEIRDHMRLLPCQREGETGGVPGAAGEEFSGGGSEDDENARAWKQLRGLTDRLHRLSNNSSGSVQEPEPTDVEQEEEGGGGKEEDTTEASVVGKRVRNGDNFTKWQHLQSIETTSKGSTHGHGHRGDDGGGEGDDTAALEEEIGELSRRLQALEADRSFLEHSVNSLRNGRDGEAVIHDIARSLRELRKTLGEDTMAS